MDPAFAKASARQACDCAGVCGVVLSEAVTLAPFLVGVLALAVLALRTPQVWRLRGIDALGVGVLAGVATLSLTATLFSSFQRLTGTTWSAGLAVMAAGLLLVKSSGDAEAQPPGFTAGQWLLLLIPTVFVGYEQFVSPVARFDDLIHYAARAGYWHVNQSVFPFESHNDRHSVFPYAGDLLFAFGVFTARSELIGRMLLFLCYPITLVMIAGMLRERAVPVSIAIGAAWIVGVTPLIRNTAIGVKPDQWGLVFALIAINAVWSYWESGTTIAQRTRQTIVLFGAVCAAIAVKLTFLLLAPLTLFSLIARLPRRSWLWAACTIPCWAIAFGLAVSLPYNKRQHGGWLGSPAMTAAHQREPGAAVALRHLARLPFVIVGVPFIPTEGLRQKTEATLRAAADRVGATSPIPLEDPIAPWPGMFVPEVTRFDYKFSLLWFFIGMAALASIVKSKQLLAHPDGRRAVVTLLIGAGFVVGVAVTVRWQTYSWVPERFIVAGMVIAFVGAAWLWYLTLWDTKYVGTVAVMMAAFHALPFLNMTRVSLVQSPRQVAENMHKWYPLGNAALAVQPGSRVLLFASQDGTDYLMFHPAYGYPTKVYPWGKAPFSATAFAKALLETQADTVVFERPDRLRFGWQPDVAADIAVAPFIDFLENHTSFRPRVGRGPSLIYVRQE